MDSWKFSNDVPFNLTCASLYAPGLCCPCQRDREGNEIAVPRVSWVLQGQVTAVLRRQGQVTAVLRPQGQVTAVLCPQGQVTVVLRRQGQVTAVLRVRGR